MTTSVDQVWMARAIQLTERGRYTTDPNPRVGCVLVKDGERVGEGWHRRAGEPHAEPLALAQAGSQARGATAYVTLEPCCHEGRTPPCTDALIAAGVARVVAAMVDPNPRVAGQGLARLQAAGIRVESGLMSAAAEALNPGFVKRMRGGGPWCRLKLAASLDGRTAMASGESRWITSEAARADVQRLRAGSSAILTGIGTLLADDPSLNVRLPPDALGLAADQVVRQPRRVVVDSRLRMSPSARLLRLPGTTLVACVDADPDLHAALEAAGAEILIGPATNDGQVELGWLWAELARREVNELLIESGPTLAGAALRAGLVDEIILYLAPHLMGDAARGLFRLPGLERMAERVPLALTDVRQVGPDLRLTLRPTSRPG